APAWEPSAAKAAPPALNTSAATAQSPARRQARAEVRRTVDQVMGWGHPGPLIRRAGECSHSPPSASAGRILQSGRATRGVDGNAIANYLQQGYGGGEGLSAWLSHPCRTGDYPPLPVMQKLAGGAAAARLRSPKSSARSPRGRRGRCGRSSWPFLGRAISSRSATWIRAIGRPRS